MSRLAVLLILLLAEMQGPPPAPPPPPYYLRIPFPFLVSNLVVYIRYFKCCQILGVCLFVCLFSKFFRLYTVNPVISNRQGTIRNGRGVARIFQRGGEGHTVSNIIVMAVSPRNIVGCLLKKGLQRGGGGGHGPPRIPLATPLNGSRQRGFEVSRVKLQ